MLGVEQAAPLWTATGNESEACLQSRSGRGWGLQIRLEARMQACKMHFE